MAKNNKNKKRKKSNLNPLVKLALKREVAKRVDSQEERDKIMRAFESLDMKTLLTDPEALAAVMANPAEELKNYMIENPHDCVGEDTRDAVEGEVEEVCSSSMVPDDESAKDVENEFPSSGDDY